MSEHTGEEVSTILRENGIGLYDLCKFWIYCYPTDVFKNEPDEVVQIRKLMEKILEKRGGAGT